MSLALLYPLGLAALAAWLLPLLIHLARRQQYAPLDFAALRWLQARLRPRSRIRVDEWPLLLVRLLLLAALALLLAGPVMRDAPADKRLVSVVAPGLDALALRGADREGDWRWLATGFPALDEPTPATAQALASLLRELDHDLPADTPLRVYIPDPMPGLDGERIRLSRSVQWQPVRMPPDTPADARPAPRLYPGGTANPDALRVLEALQRAWSGSSLPPLTDSRDAAPAPNQIGVWLSSAPLPPKWQAWLADGGTVLQVSDAPSSGSADFSRQTAPSPGSADFSRQTAPSPGSADFSRQTAPTPEQPTEVGPTRTPAQQPTEVGPTWTPAMRDARGAVLLEQRAQGRGRLLRFTAPLSVDALPAVADADFPHRLQQILQPVPVPALAAADEQVPLTGALAAPQPPRELSAWLIALIVLLFALERWLATSPRRRTVST